MRGRQGRYLGLQIGVALFEAPQFALALLQELLPLLEASLLDSLLGGGLHLPSDTRVNGRLPCGSGVVQGGGMLYLGHLEEHVS